MKNKYVVKITCTATEKNVNFKGETQTYYIGKDGYVHDHKNEVSITGWCHPRWAQKYIDEDRAWNEKWDARHWKAWDCTYEIETI